MKPLLFIFGTSSLALQIVSLSNLETGDMDLRQFPDQETYIRILTDVNNRDVILFCSLDYPNEKLLPLLLTAKTLTDLGAKSVGLIAPYLSYMRQDIQFNPGEGITSRYFADLISSHFDWMITIAPHLHRYKSLDEIYSIPTFISDTSRYIAQWIKKNINNPIIIGPDVESVQWVQQIAENLHAPYTYAEKQRLGDYSVTMQFPDIDLSKSTLVLMDDIISTGVTMSHIIAILKSKEISALYCIGIHAVFAQDAYERLLKMGADIITCNTIPHATNRIDLSEAICASLKTVFRDVS